MAMNAASYRRPITGGTAKKPFFTAKTPKGADDHMETPFVSLPAVLAAQVQQELQALASLLSY